MHVRPSTKSENAQNEKLYLRSMIKNYYIHITYQSLSMSFQKKNIYIYNTNIIILVTFVNQL